MKCEIIKHQSEEFELIIKDAESRKFHDFFIMCSWIWNYANKEYLTKKGLIDSSKNMKEIKEK